MQVSGSQIAAQSGSPSSALDVARQAQARFQAQVKSPAPAAPGAVRNAAQPPSATATAEFAPLPLKQAQAPAQAPAALNRPQGHAPVRLGRHIDITV
jgi:hypothetical protein